MLFTMPPLSPPSTAPNPVKIRAHVCVVRIETMPALILHLSRRPLVDVTRQQARGSQFPQPNENATETDRSFLFQRYTHANSSGTRKHIWSPVEKGQETFFVPDPAMNDPGTT
jgi:hypothetical protein